jgi:hypothetical protein
MLKRIISIAMVAVLTLSISACSNNEPAASKPNPASAASSSSTKSEAPKFKIGIMSNSISQSEEAYRAAQRLQQKYGDMVVIDTFPDKIEQETTISKTMAMAADPQVKVIIFNQAVAGTLASIKKLKEKRPDIFTIACNMNEDADQMAATADMLLTKDHNGLGEQVAKQAIKLKAKNFVHYSFPRHMSNQVVAIRTALMKKLCTEAGINFLEVTAPDPTSDAGVAGTQQFILEDVPNRVKELGKDTVFFTTNISINEPLVKSVIEQGAFFITQSDPSPFDSFPSVLGIKVPDDKKGDSDYMLAQIKEKIGTAGMSGRISTWNRSLIQMMMFGGFEYAIKHCKGETKESKGEMDKAVLDQIFKEQFGQGAKVGNFVNASQKEYHHFFIILGTLYEF